MSEVTEEVKKRAEEYYRQREQEKANQKIEEFTRRLDAGDPTATVEIELSDKRDEFEEQSFQRFFSRHIGIIDCDASRSLLREYFHGDLVTLGGLEMALEKLRDRLPKRAL